MLNPTEAVYGFAAWLTTRDETTVMGASHDSSAIANLVARFCEINGLPPVTGGWPEGLRFPLVPTLEGDGE